MKHILITWLVLSVAVWVSAAVVPGIQLKGLKGALVVGAIFGLLNWAIGWLIFVALGVVTLGLGFLLAFITRWIANAILLKLTDRLTNLLTIRSFGSALVASLVMSAVGTLAQWVIR